MANINESGQMYLETIYILSQKKEMVRAIDVGTYMNFSKPSVSRALSILKDNNLISVAKNGSITLNEEGLEIAKRIYEKHEVLTDIFISLGVDKEIAERDACRIEHVISEETYQAIISHKKS